MKQALLSLFLILTACIQYINSQEQSTPPSFYQTDKIQDIKITFEDDNWAYTLDSLCFNGDGFLNGTVEINGETFEGVGIQYRGTKSFRTGASRNPFNIKLNHTDKSQNLDGYSTLKLSSALRDPSIVLHAQTCHTNCPVVLSNASAILIAYVSPKSDAHLL